jgi:hypothetical protein
MYRFLFVLVVILIPATFAGDAATGQTVLPDQTIPPVQSPFLTLVGSCAPTHYDSSVLGEIINRSFTQAYSVTLEVVLDIGPGETYTETFMPAFPATLPEQPNPFCYYWFGDFDYLLSLYIRNVAVIDATAYAPVTVIPQRILCTDPHTSYSGVIEVLLRNDNAFPVYAIRFSVWGPTYTKGFQSAQLAPGVELLATTNTYNLCSIEGTPRLTLDGFRSAAQGLRSSDVWLPLIRR